MYICPLVPYTLHINRNPENVDIYQQPTVSALQTTGIESPYHAFEGKPGV